MRCHEIQREIAMYGVHGSKYEGTYNVVNETHLHDVMKLAYIVAVLRPLIRPVDLGTRSRLSQWAQRLLSDGYQCIIVNERSIAWHRWRGMAASPP
jgi:hypothetical protein